MTKFETIVAALASPDLDVPEQSLRSDSSFGTLVSNLEIGEIATRSAPLDPDMMLCDYDRTLPPLRVRARNNAAPAVKRAKDAVPGADYRVEVREVMLQAGGALVTCVTRVR